MLELLIELVVVVGACVVWFAGRRLFLQSDLSRRFVLDLAGTVSVI